MFHGIVWLPTVSKVKLHQLESMIFMSGVQYVIRSLVLNDKYNGKESQVCCQVLHFWHVFLADQNAFCGNNIVEEGEECDCGYEGECQEQCCYPAGTQQGKPCSLRPNSYCRYVTFQQTNE